MRGFSLIELSIVLVILGLLTGGILAGKSLIRAGELRSVVTEHDRYKTALGAFRDKYFGLPGDLPMAVRIWGAQAGSNADGLDATCMALTTPATSQATCNGNGDGKIGGPELFRSWQQLANAGLIEGSFTGIAGSSGPSHAVAGTNVPASYLGSAGWSLLYMDPVTTTSIFPSSPSNFLAFGSNFPTEADYMNNPIITASEAWNIDSKLDDGFPNTGKARSWRYASRPSCINAAETEYAYANTTLGCNLVFTTGY